MNFSRLRSVTMLAAQAGAMLAATSPPPVRPPATIKPAASPLFDAARELLRPGADRSAILATLKERFPDTPYATLDEVLRAAAVEVMP
jgi:hypothetical protein